MHTAFFALAPGTLTRQDIMDHEPAFTAALRGLFAFSSHNLLFPTSPPPNTEPFPGQPHGQALLDQSRLTLPLVHGGQFLAVFVAQGVDAGTVGSMLPWLPLLASQCLEQLLLRKQAMTDPLTGLWNGQCLDQALVRAISEILASVAPGPDIMADTALGTHSACFGLLLIGVDHLRQINASYGHLFGDDLLRLAAQKARDICPRQALVCRLYQDTLAVLWPRASRSKLGALAQSLNTELGAIATEFTPLQEEVRLSVSIGLAAYPQDLRGAQLQKTPAEQGRLLVERTQKALDTARARSDRRVCAFHQILTQGGVVLAMMPMNRLIINLGRSVDAHEGQHFLVWSQNFIPPEAQDQDVFGPSNTYPAMCKGEIFVVEVRADVAVAEILYLADPDWSLEQGDLLTLLEARAGLGGQLEVSGPPSQQDPLTGLYPYRDFLQEWAAVRNQARSFCLMLARIQSVQEERSPQVQMKEEEQIRSLAVRARSVFGEQALGGRYSAGGVVFYLPEISARDCLQQARTLMDDEDLAHLNLITGIACFPFLDYTRSETLANARKALQHAAMLEERIACFDSVSLNISADRLYAQDEVFDAMAEYKKSLAADDTNALARNSLGVCYAQLGKFGAACAIFQDLVQRDPHNVMARYNHACAYLKEGDLVTAKESFEAVLAIDPDHMYTLTRLGLMAEEEGDIDGALAFFSRVLALPRGERLACRYLARLAYRQGRLDQAGEYLHQAITANPQDAQSFHLLATIYLERGDDPEIAESLARQSVHLNGDVPAFWDVLITALEQQGKDEDVAQTRSRALAQIG